MPHASRVLAAMSDPVQVVYVDLLLALERAGGTVALRDLRRDSGAPLAHLNKALWKLEDEGRIQVEPPSKCGERRHALVHLIG